MTKQHIFCIIFMMFSLFSQAWSQNENPNCSGDLTGYTSLGEFNDASYYISNHTNSWQNASAEAAALGGYLASIESQAENEFIRNGLGSTIAFIGYSDDQSEGTFYWDSGEATTYSNLSGNGNNNANNDYGVINFWNGKWNLENKWVYKKFIVEIPCSSSNEPCQLSISNVIFPAIVQPGETVMLTATVSNDGTQTSAPTQVNLYQFRNTIHGPPPVDLVEEGAAVPALAAGAYTTVAFQVTLADPLYVHVIAPEQTSFAWGGYTLIIVDDTNNGSPAYLNCNTPVAFEVDYDNADLGIAFVNNDGCYGEDDIARADLQLTNHGPMTTTAPIYVRLAVNPIFLNPNLDGEVFYNFNHNTVYWIIRTPLAAGESVRLTRPYKVVEGTTVEVDFTASVLPDVSNVEDVDSGNDSATAAFIPDENCGEGEELPDFDLLNVGYLTSTIINPELNVLIPGDRVPTGVNITIPFHGVGGFSPIPNQLYETTTTLYLSTNDVIDSGDIILNSFDNPILALGTAIFQEGGMPSFEIPHGTALGSYFLITKIDANNDIAETDEQNNTHLLFIEVINGDCDCEVIFNPVCGVNGTEHYNACFAQCVGVTEYTAGTCDDQKVDLMAGLMQFDNPVEISDGSAIIPVMVEVKNVGNIDFSGTITTQFCLTDNQLSCDMEMGIITSEPVNIAAGSFATVTYMVSIAAFEGNHFLVANLDIFDDIVELNNNNNRTVQDIFIIVPCICPTVIAPVCGADGVTYPNACSAECAGVFDYAPGECLTGDGVDLELSLIAPPNYSIYTNVLFQVEIFNNGTINAENVTVDVPLPDGFVHSSNDATNGSYDLFRETWNAGTIKVGETAILDLNLFALTNTEVTMYAQVAAANPDDIDSTPGNGTCCIAQEDDEDAITVSSNFAGDETELRGQSSSEAILSTDLAILNVYPNVATDNVQVVVQSASPSLHVRIYNLQGQVVQQEKYTHSTGLLNLNLKVSDLASGTYFIQLSNDLERQIRNFVKL